MIYDRRPFKLERDMLAPLKRSLTAIINAPDGIAMKVVREPSVGVVIPDLLVGLVHRPRRILARSSFTTVEASVLASLEQYGIGSLEEILQRLFLPTHTGQRVIEKLARAGAIRANREGQWTISEPARSHGVELIAIEAKLQLWKRALEQAKTYLAFVDRSYVVLDGNRVQPFERMTDAFKNSGVGLWLQHGFMLRELVPAASTKVAQFSADRVRATEKVLRTRSISRGRAGVGMSQPTLECAEPSTLMRDLVLRGTPNTRSTQHGS